VAAVGTVAAVLGAACATTVPPAAGLVSAKPNVVVIMADDMGVIGRGWVGADKVPSESATPSHAGRVTRLR
jgi:hypothetical protein